MSPLALYFLILILAGFGITISYLLLRPGRYTPWERCLYAPVYVIARFLWRVEICRRDPNSGEWKPTRRLLVDDAETWDYTPKKLGAIVIANHRSSVDPFFIQIAAGARVHWMVAGEYFKAWIVGSLLRTYQAIPTNRKGVDTASTKKAIALASQGSFVGMFPEGRINRTDQPFIPVRPGAAIVALRAGVPIVPVWITGARMGSSVISPLFMPTQVRIHICDANSWGLEQLKLNDGRSDREIANEWIRVAIAQCLKDVGVQSNDIQLAGASWMASIPDSAISSTD